jgi:hypothetical protein
VFVMERVMSVCNGESDECLVLKDNIKEKEVHSVTSHKTENFISIS